MAGSTNIVGIAFATIASTRSDQLQAVMDTIIAAEAAMLSPIVKAVFTMFVARQFFLIMWGEISARRFVGSIMRACVVALLIGHTNQFDQYVRTPLFVDLPQATASWVGSGTGAQGNLSTAAQLDVASAAVDAVTAKALELTTGMIMGPTGIARSIAMNAADAGIQIMLGIMAWVWLLGQTFLAIIICFGPLVLLFELFDRTRGFVDQWIGKIVGITAFGIGTSMILAIEMQGFNSMMQQVDAGMPSNAAGAVALLLHVMVGTLVDAFTLVALPGIVSFGSGVAAGIAAPAAFAMGRAAAGVTTAGKMAGGAVKRMGGGGDGTGGSIGSG